MARISALEVKGDKKLAANLRSIRNRYGQPGDRDVHVGFTAEYALHVHENLQVKHTNGQAKYLEQPFREMQGELIGIAATAIKRGVKLTKALLLAGKRLEREAQKLVPVDTGNLKYAIVALGFGTLPENSAAWPVHVESEPDVPDNCITVQETAGTLDGKDMAIGQLDEHLGAQIRVRSVDHAAGFTKARAVAVGLDEITRYGVNVENSIYFIQNVSRKSGPLSIGNEPTSKRKLFTINVTISLRQTT
jgi:hypothetical protein